MSNTIDQRVVEMQFDNRQFESGVQTSLSTLEKLKQGLNLTGATKGFENVNTAANKVSFAGLLNGVEAVQVKFSYLQASIQHQINRIVDSTINAGKRMASALTIDPIKTGFAEYETQINAVQTILANTKSKGTDINDVNGALDELNTYADKTIYNFTEMTRNIGTFTAAGVDLDKSVTSIKGIANLAAVSGSTSQQASTAMYQLSQALAAGKVQLMDWNSVVNAGMGGQVFQDALKRTATHMGTNVDAMIKKYGSFRESLTQGEWLTAEVLTETLTQLSGAYTKADLLNKGYTEEQAKEILELAKTAEDAATKVKTFSQLWDTLKESAQSGWTQTWEIIVGDFEEAKTLLTKVSDTIGAMIGESAESRNKMLQDWKDMGGRTALIEGIGNAFQGLMNIITPLKEAFREIFPPITGKQLYDLTMNFAVFTKKLILSEEQMGKLKDIFKGFFSIIDIGVTFIKDVGEGLVKLLGNFTGLGGGILDAGKSFGDWASNLRDSIKEGDVFGRAVDKIVDILSNAITAIKNFAKAVTGYFGSIEFEGFLDIFEGIWNFIKLIGTKIVDAFASIGEGVAKATGESGVFNVLNSGLFAGILVGINNFVHGLSDPFEGVSGLFEGIGETLDSVRGCFEAYQKNLQADMLMKIAKAIGILAAAILILAIIDGEALNRALGAITVLFADLMGSLALFDKMGTGLKGATKAMGMMVAMSWAILILAGAMKIISTIDWNGIAKGLVAVGALMAELSIFMATAKVDKNAAKSTKGLIALSIALLILSKAVENFAALSWEDIGKGLASIGALLVELGVFTKLAGGSKNMISIGVGMVLLGTSMKIFASAVGDFASMNMEQLKTGMLGFAGALLGVAIAMQLMPKNMISSGIGMIAVAGGMMILVEAFKQFSALSADELKIGLTAMGGALIELVVALNLMNGTIGGSMALIIAAGALAILAPVLQSLGGMSLSEIGMALLSIAGAFAVVGVAGLLLAPLVPVILGLSAAFALFGVAALGIGAGISLIGVGLGLISAGIGTLATALTGGVTAIVAGISVLVTGVASLIPAVAITLAEGIVAFAAVIANGAPVIADAVKAIVLGILDILAVCVPKLIEVGIDLIMALLKGIRDNIQEIVEVAIDIVINFVNGIANSIGKVVQAGVNLIIKFINGMANAIRNNSNAMIAATDNLMDAVIGALVGWFDSFKSKGKEIITNILSGLKSKFSDVISSAKDIGKNIIEGLKSGIKNGAKAVVEAAKGVVSGAIEGAKKLLGINSPSKVFYEIGDFSGLGFINALKDYASRAYSSGANMGESAVDGIGSAISQIQKALNGNMDAQPVITPVLDLSNITAGAKGINGLFDDASLNANIGSISATMNRRNQNGTTDDVVYAINKLRKDLSELDRNSYNIGDIVYEEGSGVAEAIKTLVRAAKVDRRV